MLSAVNQSLSTFDPNSIISRFNQGAENVAADSFFVDVFTKAVEVSEISDGAFDITIAPIVNAWGFGFEKHETVNAQIIDSLMQFVGMQNVYLDDGIIKRKKPGVMLNVSAIAKGYGVDVVANYLKNSGIKNFMVEIGGEIVTGGVNKKGNMWRIAINSPTDDISLDNRQFTMILQLSGKGLATSGNYRNFHVIDGKKQGHTIDPRTGYPVQTSVLSATIIAPDCMTADAFATVCMVIGLEKSLKLLETVPNIEGCFIYETNNDGITDVAYTSGFEKYIFRTPTKQ